MYGYESFLAEQLLKYFCPQFTPQYLTSMRVIFDATFESDLDTSYSMGQAFSAPKTPPILHTCRADTCKRRHVEGIFLHLERSFYMLNVYVYM